MYRLYFSIKKSFATIAGTRAPTIARRVNSRRAPSTNWRGGAGRSTTARCVTRWHFYCPALSPTSPIGVVSLSLAPQVAMMCRYFFALLPLFCVSAWRRARSGAWKGTGRSGSTAIGGGVGPRESAPSFAPVESTNTIAKCAYIVFIVCTATVTGTYMRTHKCDDRWTLSYHYVWLSRFSSFSELLQYLFHVHIYGLGIQTQSLGEILNIENLMAMRWSWACPRYVGVNIYIGYNRAWVVRCLTVVVGSCRRGFFPLVQRGWGYGGVERVREREIERSTRVYVCSRRWFLRDGLVRWVGPEAWHAARTCRTGGAGEGKKPGATSIRLTYLSRFPLVSWRVARASDLVDRGPRAEYYAGG